MSLEEDIRKWELGKLSEKETDDLLKRLKILLKLKKQDNPYNGKLVKILSNKKNIIYHGPEDKADEVKDYVQELIREGIFQFDWRIIDAEPDKKSKIWTKYTQYTQSYAKYSSLKGNIQIIPYGTEYYIEGIRLRDNIKNIELKFSSTQYAAFCYKEHRIFVQPEGKPRSLFPENFRHLLRSS